MPNSSRSFVALTASQVTDEESRTGKSDPTHKRGLLFVSYQSSLDNGFVRQSVDYGGNRYFPTTSLTPTYHGKRIYLYLEPAR